MGDAGRRQHEVAPDSQILHLHPRTAVLFFFTFRAPATKMGETIMWKNEVFLISSYFFLYVCVKRERETVMYLVQLQFIYTRMKYRLFDYHEILFK